MYQQPNTSSVERAASIALVALVSFANFYSAPTIISGVELSLDPSQAAGGSAIPQLLFGCLFAAVVGIVLVSWRSDVIWRTPRFPLWILCWCWLSLLWTTDPGASFRRLVYTTIIILTASYIVELLPHDQLMRVLAATLAVVVIADWAAILLVPAARQGLPDPLDPDSGWRGLHLDKNEAGAVLANCLIFFVHETRRTKSRITGPLLCVASAVFLVETNSKTSMGFSGVAILIGAICARAYVNLTIRSLVLLGSVGLILTGIGAWDDLIRQLNLLLVDPTAFTGRSQIWTVLLQYARDHMLLGAGYGSFWGIGDASPILSYGGGWLASVYEAHDGYLDLLVNVGLIGLVIAVCDLVIRPLWVVFTRPLDTGVSRSMLCAFVIFTCLHNLLESTFLERATPAWVLAVVAYAVLFKNVSEVNSMLSGPPAHVTNPNSLTSPPLEFHSSDARSVSTPERNCIGTPEQNYITGAQQGAPYGAPCASVIRREDWPIR